MASRKAAGSSGAAYISLGFVCSLLAFSCSETSTSTTATCDVGLDAVKPRQAAPGYSTALSGRLFTDAYDTAVYLGPTRATVNEVLRYQCDDCDTCLEENSCNPCADCDTCDPYCNECVELVIFQVPDMSPGDTTVRLFNRHGESNGLDFTVEDWSIPEDTGDLPTTADSQGDTSADSETATETATPTDSAPTDSNGFDSGATETAIPDSGL